MKEDLERIREAKKAWEEGPLAKTIKKFPYCTPESSRFYSPLDIEDFDFLEKVGFPGTYPFTAGTFAIEPLAGLARFAHMAGGGEGTGQIPGAGPTRAAIYSGYGTPEDTRDYYKGMLERGGRGGPNLAFDLPTQCGY
ncbi:MAG: hypothetical protein K6U89_20320, partial [Chloroflexi bacterium]|nr:hypothetical protein [Chloroflexota bacterium]